jgi:hypothetical protein
MRWTAALVAIVVTVVSGRVWADPNVGATAPEAVTPLAPVLAQAVPPASEPQQGYPPPQQGYPPPQQGYAPPPAYAPPPGYAPPPPQGYGTTWNGAPAYRPTGPDPNAMFMYEAQKKSGAMAVLLSLLLPGVGNIYADHFVGAVITWALIIGGAVVAVDSVKTTDTYGYYSSTSVNSGELTLGVVMILGGEIYSPIDAYIASENYNHDLAQRLGLPTGFVLAPQPIRTDRGVAWGPGLAMRF